MPTRLLSIFGTYDFFAKSLPGMVLVVGLFPLLKANTVEIPSLADKFLTFVILLVIIGLLGTLFGEVVHSIAILAERVFAWFGKRGLNTKDFFRDRFPILPSLPKPTNPPLNQRRQARPEDGGLALRIYKELENLLKSWYSGIYLWASNRKEEIKNTVRSHRGIFETKLNQPADLDSFTHQHLHDFVLEELRDGPQPNSDEVYSVIVSYLSQNQSDRSDRFQSRYAFCRSMAFVLLFVGIAYLVVVNYPATWPVPEAMRYQPYLFAYYKTSVSSVVSTVAALLLIFSVMFSFAAGEYKRRYIEYLVSELYVARQLPDLSNGERETKE